MDKYKEFLNKKVFGVKMLYVALVVVVILGLVAWKMKNAGTGAGADTADTADTADAAAGDTGVDDVPTTVTPSDSSQGIGSGGVSTGGVTTDPVYTPPAAQLSNDTWMRMGIDWLIKQGVPSDQATMALQAYLAGDQLSYDQGQLRERVIAQFGLPPEIPQSGGTANKPTTPKPPPKVTPGTQKPPLNFKTTASINTYGEIAQKFYGSTNDRYIDLLQAHNLKLGHAGPFKVGTTVFVPAKSEPHYFTATKTTRTLGAIAAKNGTSIGVIKELNDKTHFPVAVGHKVRVA
jgi:LysM repeat protein